jgi:site-specific DNA-methyltransferase (cytosine-N4-specific)
LPSVPPVRLIHGDCLQLLDQLAPQSVDAVVTDPPYPEIDRPYGRLSEADWRDMMRAVVEKVRRVLKPSGSAVFILQPNSEIVGRMRPWLWEFQAWLCREWNVVQDAYWWNPTAMPTVHAQRKYGLMRPSVKACVWAGAPDCYRNQDAVLWSQSAANAATDRSDRALRKSPSGHSVRPGRTAEVAAERGGTTPFNLIPIPNSDSQSSGGAAGHGAATPLPLCEWWVKYLTPPGGVVLDPFSGSGTVGVACVRAGVGYIGCEIDPSYFETAQRRIAAAAPAGEARV